MNPSRKKYIAVVDYGLGNLRSVAKALESVGAEVTVTSNPQEILEASGIVLPGVGAFYRGIENLKQRGLVSVILEVINKDKPFLGICLGLQLLFTQSQEHGLCKGLDVIAGEVKKFSPGVKIPHMGWNQVKLVKEGLFKDVPDNSYFYFVHSYAVEPKDREFIAATAVYGREFTSGVNKGNLWGVQFHPEKSSVLGLKILENFVNMVNKS